MRVLAPEALRPGPDASGLLDHTSDLRFLLIEDSTPDSDLVRGLLEIEFPHGEVDVATNLELALHRLAEAHYDVILADLTLPDAAGEAVVRAVRGASPQTALMVLTGRTDGTLALWTLAEGAQDYLVKGQHDGPRLAEALLHGLQRSRTERTAHARLISALARESEAAEQLRALDAAKDDFVATASHELRTPLTSIVAYSQLLLDEGALNPRQERFADSIARNSGRLAALVDDLLLLSTFDFTRPPTGPQEVDLRAVVASAQDVIAVLGAEKNLAVSIELPDSAVRVTGDAQQLERVVVNLMSNAVKFTEAGGRVTCRLASSAADAFLSVADSGIGIPTTEQGELFSRFFRGSAARDRAVPGTGLGLHIVATLVADHGGEVSVESVAGLGTTFTVRLPLLIEAETPVGRRAGAGPRVLRDESQARFLGLLGLPDADPEAAEIAAALEGALGAARDTHQWELLGDALRFARDRLRVRGASETDFENLVAALARSTEALLPDEATRLSEVLTGLVTPSGASPSIAADEHPLATAYLDHLLAKDRAGAVALTKRCTSDGMSAAEVLSDVLEPAQREVGRRWAVGQVSLLQEHFCTSTTELVMNDLYPTLATGRVDEPQLVAVQAHGSLHHVGLRMVADVLGERGWCSTIVGGDIAVEALTTLLTEVGADLLLVSASMPGQIRHVSALIHGVHHDPRTRHVKVVVGGRPFRVAPDLAHAVGADGWARDARGAAEVCDELVGRAP